MRFVLAVLLLLGGTFASSAIASRTPLTLHCARHLAEEIWGNDSADLLRDWEEAVEKILLAPAPESRKATSSYVRLGWLSGKRKRAFVRGSDAAQLSLGQQLDLSRHAHHLHHAVRWSTPHNYPTVFGPALVSKELVTEMFLGPTDASRWSNLSRSIERQNGIANRSFARMLVSGAVALAAACAAGVCQYLEGWPSAAPNLTVLLPAAIVSGAALVDAGLAMQRSRQEDAKVAQLREVRARMSGEALPSIDLSDGPFHGHDEALRFRDFARESVAEWQGLREGDSSRWWFFTGNQGHETVDMLIYSLVDNAEDLEVLTVVR